MFLENFQNADMGHAAYKAAAEDQGPFFTGKKSNGYQIMEFQQNGVRYTLMPDNNGAEFFTPRLKKRINENLTIVDELQRYRILVPFKEGHHGLQVVLFGAGHADTVILYRRLDFMFKPLNILDNRFR